MYIGQTIRPLKLRIVSHVCNKTYTSYIGNALRLHGLGQFNVCVIDSALNRTHLNLKEEYWINKMGTLFPNGYNMNTGGNSRIPSALTIEKIKYAQNTSECKSKKSKATKEVWKRPGYKKKISETIRNAMLGKTLTHEHKTAIKKALSKISVIENRSNVMKEAWKKDDLRNKMSIGFKNYFANPENRIKHGECLKKSDKWQKSMTSETRKAKIGEAARKNWENEEYRTKTLNARKTAKLKRDLKEFT